MAKPIEEEKGLHIVTTESVPGYKTIEVKGLVWASSVRAKSIFKDILAMFRVIIGGEVYEYWELINEARHDILAKLNRNGKEIGANAIVDINFITSQVVPGTIEIMAYGTAVRVEKE